MTAHSYAHTSCIAPEFPIIAISGDTPVNNYWQWGNNNFCRDIAISVRCSLMVVAFWANCGWRMTSNFKVTTNECKVLALSCNNLSAVLMIQSLFFECIVTAKSNGFPFRKSQVWAEQEEMRCYAWKEEHVPPLSHYERTQNIAGMADNWVTVTCAFKKEY